MAARATLLLLLLLATALGGCFYALDGSLVKKTRDGGADGARLEGGVEAGSKTDTGIAADAGVADTSPSG